MAEAIELHADLEFNTVELFGSEFRMNPSELYEVEMMDFAEAAKGGADTDLLSEAAAVKDFLRAVIHPDDWDEFWATAKRKHATVQGDLMPIVVGAFTQQTRRPTSRPSVSSGGPKRTKRKSEGGSSSQVIRRLEKKGRPDLALMVLMADEVRSAASA